MHCLPWSIIIISCLRLLDGLPVKTSSGQNVPSSSQNVPSSSQNVPSSSQNVPSSSQNVLGLKRPRVKTSSVQSQNVLGLETSLKVL